MNPSYIRVVVAPPWQCNTTSHQKRIRHRVQRYIYRPGDVCNGPLHDFRCHWDGHCDRRGFVANHRNLHQWQREGHRLYRAGMIKEKAQLLMLLRHTSSDCLSVAPPLEAHAHTVTVVSVCKEGCTLIGPWGYLNRKLPFAELPREPLALFQWILSNTRD